MSGRGRSGGGTGVSGSGAINPRPAALFAPTVTHGLVYDGANDASTYRYIHDASLAWFGGKWVVQANAGVTDAEGAAGQYIVQFTSADFVNWTAPVRVFCDATTTSNPITDTGSNIQWQPGMIVVGGELWSFWYESAPAPKTYLSRLSSIDGKWVTRDLNIGTIVDDGISYQACFVSGNPVQLDTGRVLVPVILQSNSTDPSAVGLGGFAANYRMCAVLISDDSGSTWRVGGMVTQSGKPWGVWEPALVVQPDGVLRMYCRNQQQGPLSRYAAPITFTAGLAAATSGTLTAGFSGATGAYNITFSDGSIRAVTLTNGNTGVTWATAVTATAQANVQSQTDFSRNMLTCSSTNFGESWSALQPVGSATGISRPGIVNAGDRTGVKYLLKEDYDGTNNFNLSRRALSVWAGTGANDFMPLACIAQYSTEPGWLETYAQGVLLDGKIYVVSTALEDAYVSSSIRTHVVDSVPARASLGIRGNVRAYETAPSWRATGTLPAAYVFGGQKQKLTYAGSTAGWSTSQSSGAATVRSRKTVQSVLFDNRDVTTGYMVQVGASYTPGDTKIILRYYNAGVLTDLDSGVSAPTRGGPYFVAWAVDTSAKTFTVWTVLVDGTVTTNTVAIPGTPGQALGVAPSLFSSKAGSTLQAFTGDVYRSRFYDVVLTTNNVRAVWETDRGQINGASWAGTQTFPSSRFNLLNSNPDAGTNNATWLLSFSALGSLQGDVQAVTDGAVSALKVMGNASLGWAPCSPTWQRGQYHLRYKTPAGRSNEVAICTIGNADEYIEITKASASAGTLQVRRGNYLDGTSLTYITTASAIPFANDRYYGLTIGFGPGRVTISHDKALPIELPFDGAPTVYVGRAHGAPLLTADTTVDYVLFDRAAFGYGESAARETVKQREAQSGTWTPTLKFGGAATGIAYAPGLQSGFWYRLGDMVFWSLDISLTSKGSATGAATISGLPFGTLLNANGASNAQGGHCTFANGMDTTAGSGAITATHNGTDLTLRIMSAGAAVTLADTHFGGTARLRMQGSFMALDPVR